MRFADLQASTAAAAADRPPGLQHGHGPRLTIEARINLIYGPKIAIFGCAILSLFFFSDIISIERAKSAKCTESAENGGKTDLFLMDNRPIISHLF